MEKSGMSQIENISMAELNALGGMIVNPDTIPVVAETLPDPGQYGSQTGQLLAQAIYALHDSSDHEVNEVTIMEALDRRGHLDNLGGADAIAAIMERCADASIPSVKSSAEIVLEDYMKREAQKFLERFDFDGSADADSQIEHVIEQLEDIRTNSQSAESVDVGEAGRELGTVLEEICDGERDRYSTGFPKLDDAMNKIDPSDLILCTADTGQGKTSLALQIADTIAEGQGGNVLVFSGEMQFYEIAMKILSKRGDFDLNELTSPEDLEGEMREMFFERLDDAIDELGETSMELVRERTPTIYDLKSAIRRTDRELREDDKGGLDFVVFDYVQMLENPAPGEMDDFEHLNFVSDQLREMTNDFQIPIFAISRENSEGTSYGTTQLKYDANTILRIRPVKPNNDDDDRVVLSIDKARLGEGGGVRAIFEGKHSRFVASDGSRTPAETARANEAQNGDSNSSESPF